MHIFYNVIEGILRSWIFTSYSPFIYSSKQSQKPTWLDLIVVKLFKVLVSTQGIRIQTGITPQKHREFLCKTVPKKFFKTWYYFIWKLQIRTQQFQKQKFAPFPQIRKKGERREGKKKEGEEGRGRKENRERGREGGREKGRERRHETLRMSSVTPGTAPFTTVIIFLPTEVQIIWKAFCFTRYTGRKPERHVNEMRISYVSLNSFSNDDFWRQNPAFQRTGPDVWDSSVGDWGDGSMGKGLSSNPSTHLRAGHGGICL